MSDLAATNCGCGEERSGCGCGNCGCNNEMCIRDRHGPAPCSQKLSSLPNLKIRSAGIPISLFPVSYTHLDVYKRQVEIICLLFFFAPSIAADTIA